MTFGGFLAKLLGFFLLFVAFAIVVVIWRDLRGSVTPDEVSRLQTLVVTILLPSFQTFATVIIGAGIFKGALTIFNNPTLPDDKKQQITFVKW